MLKKFKIFAPLLGVFLNQFFTELRAQDIQFSQFYANVLYLNPAFAGSAMASRAIFHERLQWPALDAKYTTTSFSLDHSFEKYNSGLGIFVLRDFQGAKTLSTTEAAIQYSYEVTLSQTFSFRAGVESKYVSRYINYSFLTLPDQYSNNGFQNNQTAEPFGNDKVQYLDLSAGGILYTEKFWFGLAANHLNTPQQSFYAGSGDSQLPLKFDFVSGYKIYLEKKTEVYDEEKGREISFIPTVHYKTQGKSDQIDIGIYALLDHVITGVWYRGIPIAKHYRPGLINNESVIYQLGWKINNLSITYSYDFTLSKLVRARTGGSHELNVTYVWKYPKKTKRKPMKRLPCPDFFK